jgi:hypothetical protein
LIPAKDEEEYPVLPKDRVRVIRSGGCRAVPLLLDEAGVTKNEPDFQGCHALLMGFVGKARRSNSGEGGRLCGALFGLLAPERRKEGIADARIWCRKHDAEQHPWWKPWAWSCLGD